MGRSLRHLVDTVTGLADRGIGFRSLQEAMYTTTPGGKLVFHVFAALAEFERLAWREPGEPAAAPAGATGRGCPSAGESGESDARGGAFPRRPGGSDAPAAVGEASEQLSGALWVLPLLFVVGALVLGSTLSRITIEPGSPLDPLLVRGNRNASVAEQVRLVLATAERSVKEPTTWI
jgi:hypothetical protein